MAQNMKEMAEVTADLSVQLHKTRDLLSDLSSQENMAISLLIDQL